MEHNEDGKEWGSSEKLKKILSSTFPRIENNGLLRFMCKEFMIFSDTEDLPESIEKEIRLAYPAWDDSAIRIAVLSVEGFADIRLKNKIGTGRQMDNYFIAKMASAKQLLLHSIYPNRSTPDDLNKKYILENLS